MKKIIFLMVAMLFVFSGIVHADFSCINDESNGTETDLFQICNDLYNTAYGTSNEMFSDLGIKDGKDGVWEVIGEEGLVLVYARFAGYEQELGIDDGAYKAIIARSDIDNNVIVETPVWKATTFESSNDFVFVEKFWKTHNNTGKWYSDNRNSTDDFDHFVALDVTDLQIAGSKAWLIAFEDLEHDGDYDYNDLVAVIAQVQPVTTWSEEITFDAVAGVGKVDLRWDAVSEDNVLGYNVLRAQGAAGGFSQINDVMIQAKGSIETTVDYAYTDDSVKNGRIYRYKLVEVQNDGQVAVHGDEAVFPSLLQMFSR